MGDTKKARRLGAKIMLAMFLIASLLGLAACQPKEDVLGKLGEVLEGFSGQIDKSRSISEEKRVDQRFVQIALNRDDESLDGSAYCPWGVDPSLPVGEKNKIHLAWLAGNAESLLATLQSVDLDRSDGWRGVALAEMTHMVPRDRIAGELPEGAILSDSGDEVLCLTDLGIKGYYEFEEVLLTCPVENQDRLPWDLYNSGIFLDSGLLNRASIPGMEGTGRKITLPDGRVFYVRDACLNVGVPADPRIPENPVLNPKNPVLDPGAQGNAPTGAGRNEVQVPSAPSGPPEPRPADPPQEYIPPAPPTAPTPPATPQPPTSGGGGTPAPADPPKTGSTDSSNSSGYDTPPQNSGGGTLQNGEVI